MSDLIPRPFEPPVDLTIREFQADKALGKASLYFDIANAAATMICGLYGKSPATVVNLIPVGAGLIDNSRGIFDDLCKNVAPPPPPPTVPFTGGQCDSVRYQVNFSVVDREVGGIPAAFIDTTTQGTTQVWGPVTGAFMSNPGSNSSLGLTWNGFQSVQLSCRGSGGSNIQPPGVYSPYGRSAPTLQSVQITSVVRVDGLTDSCGNPLPSYPPPSATVPDLNSTTLVHINPTTTISVPITFTPTVAPTVGNFRPEFNFNVGGINVNLSTRGFTFSPTLEIPVNLPLPYSDPRSAPGTPRPINPPSNGGGSASFDPAAIIARLKRIEQEILDCCAAGHPYSPPPPANIISTVIGSGAGGTLVLPDRTFRVDVQITTRPVTEKLQVGTLSPDVLFAGWARFSDGATTGKREPIDSVKTFFSPTERIATAFTYSLYTGYSATVIAFSVTPTPPAP